MKEDLQEKIIIELLKGEKDEELIERLPFRLIKNGDWNKDIFKEEWFIKYKDSPKFKNGLKNYINNFDNVTSDNAKLSVFIMVYWAYLDDTIGKDDAREAIFGPQPKYEYYYFDATNDDNFDKNDFDCLSHVFELPKMERDEFYEKAKNREHNTSICQFDIDEPNEITKYINVLYNDLEKYETYYKGIEGMTINEDYVFMVGGKKKVYPDRYYGIGLLKTKKAKLPIDGKIVFDKETNKYLLDVDGNICGYLYDKDVDDENGHTHDDVRGGAYDENMDRFKNLLKKHNIENFEELKCKIIGFDNRLGINYKIMVEL